MLVWSARAAYGPDGKARGLVLAFRNPEELSLTPDELIAYLRPHLARFKLPRVVEFVDAVPRSASGKALRRLLN